MTDAITPEAEQRPWGHYEVLLDAADCKVKRITVLPDKRLSYQRHFKRAEHWYVVTGTAVVTLDGVDMVVPPGAAIDIPLKAAHRVRNDESAALVFIEVQTGEYFGEDDIERIEDDFGRA
jgi:mannose-6-phosphate isomerase